MAREEFAGYLGILKRCVQSTARAKAASADVASPPGEHASDGLLPLHKRQGAGSLMLTGQPIIEHVYVQKGRMTGVPRCWQKRSPHS